MCMEVVFQAAIFVRPSYGLPKDDCRASLGVSFYIGAEVGIHECRAVVSNGMNAPAYNGMPIKSGVGSGSLAVIPRFGEVCTWSLPLDAQGQLSGRLESDRTVRH